MKPVTLKRYVPVLVAALCLAACTGRDELPAEAGDAIGFARPAVTRALVETADDLSRFSVWGWHTDGTSTAQPVFTTDGTAIPVTRDASNNWTYDNPQFWQSGHTYDFVGVWPTYNDLTGQAGATVSCQPDGTLTVAGFNSLSGNDLMTARAVDIDGSNPGGAVQMEFGHQLARVSIRMVRGSLWQPDENVEYTATLTQLGTTGTLTVSADGVASWQMTPDHTLTDGGGTLTATNTSAYLFNENNEADGSLLLIPQDLENVRVNVTYGKTGETKQTRSAMLTTTTIRGWRAGQHYAYTLTLQPDAIVFSNLTADAWGETSSGGSIPID